MIYVIAVPTVVQQFCTNNVFFPKLVNNLLHGFSSHTVFFVYYAKKFRLNCEYLGHRLVCSLCVFNIYINVVLVRQKSLPFYSTNVSNVLSTSAICIIDYIQLFI